MFDELECSSSELISLYDYDPMREYELRLESEIEITNEKNCGLMKKRMISPRSVAVPVVVVGREQLKKPCKRKSKIIEEVNRNEEEQQNRSECGCF